MRRAGYLAALGGGAGPVAAPSLRPPRRLFPHEPAPADAPPAAGEQRVPGALTRELPAVPPHAAPVTPPLPPAAPEPAPARLSPRPAERAAPDPAAPEAPAARVIRTVPPGAQEHRRAARRPPADAIEPPGRADAAGAAPVRGPAHARPRPAAPSLEAPAGAPELHPRTVPSSPAPPTPAQETLAPEPRHERVLAAAEPRRLPAPLEPPRAAPQPELRRPRTPLTHARIPAADGAPHVRIGTIEVTVVPPPAPAPPPQPRPVASRPVSSVARRSGGGPWFGLAQR